MEYKWNGVIASLVVWIIFVLILVLMEYKWNIHDAWIICRRYRLNPCFNGIQMEPSQNYEEYFTCNVLILVLMEYKWNVEKHGAYLVLACLNPCFNGIQMESYSTCEKGPYIIHYNNGSFFANDLLESTVNISKNDINKLFILL